MVSTQLKNQHLLWRAGFGPLAEEMDQIVSASPSAYLKALFTASAKSPEYFDVAGTALQGLTMGVKEITGNSPESRKQLRAASKEALKSLNITWVNEMVNSEQQLREKMSLFWHGHFASRNINIFYQQQLLGVIRTHALGSFGDLLREVSKSAAIINFLNNNQNRKGHPNENFAREVMELFTMGRGNYSETDVKDAARAFTGWGANPDGTFIFRPFQHDEGTKTILGKTGNFNGDDVLQFLLEHKQTAYFITRKIYRFFVNENIHEGRISQLAEKFYQSGYKIGDLMKEIFSSSWFYDEENIGTRIKSPVELLVGMQRAVPMKIGNPDSLLLLQKLLGQLLFYPPNVAGWPGGKNWIDSSSLMLRLRIPSLLSSAEEFQMKAKTDDDQGMGMEEKTSFKGLGKNGNRMVNSTIDWNGYRERFKKISRPDLAGALQSYLLQTKETDIASIEKYIDASSRENYIKSVTLRIMSLPEYQLC
ncbi:MAG TPA: DUF1800 domain-containing protein [Flavitalea sp.]|nr:DUF1800 domain-containing protein [Flavitalea sp.]